MCDLLVRRVCVLQMVVQKEWQGGKVSFAKRF